MKGLGVWREFVCSAVDEAVVSNSGDCVWSSEQFGVEDSSLGIDHHCH